MFVWMLICVLVVAILMTHPRCVFTVISRLNIGCCCRCWCCDRMLFECRAVAHDIQRWHEPSRLLERAQEVRLLAINSLQKVATFLSKRLFWLSFSHSQVESTNPSGCQETSSIPPWNGRFEGDSQVSEEHRFAHSQNSFPTLGSWDCTRL